MGHRKHLPTSESSVFRPGFRRAKLAMIVVGLLAASVLVVGIQSGSTPSAAAPVGIDQCNNIGSTGGDTITCTVTITNNFTYNAATPDQPTGLATIVTTFDCTGSAVCPTGSTTTSTTPVTSVTQCNTSGLGGASTVTCTATVTNNLTGYPIGATIDSTVSQCLNPGAQTVTCTATPPGNNRIGSGGPGGQSVTQCNSSSGPGGTLTCTVTAPQSQSTGLPITISQCNGSGPTGASTVTCTATITNNFFDSTPPPTTTTLPVTTTTVPVTTTTVPVTTTTVPVTTTTVPVTTTTVPVTTTTVPVTTPTLESGAGTTTTTTQAGTSAGTAGQSGGTTSSGSTGSSGGSGSATGGNQAMAFTGKNILPVAATGVIAVLLGGLVLMGSRRRTRVNLPKQNDPNL
jgi:uncharacterized membrane protein YgcG